MSAKKNLKKKPSQKEKITINYLKTNNYRTYHVDGIFGGITPDTKLYVELFVQRSVTPKVVEHEITEKGTLGKEISRTGKKGIIREIESGLIMDMKVAKIFRDWISKK
ncbi:MAG: hypothetical protein V3U40_03025, partial [Candidatus Scalindua sediminis]